MGLEVGTTWLRLKLDVAVDEIADCWRCCVSGVLKPSDAMQFAVLAVSPFIRELKSPRLYFE
jgi:hypothetical protein